MPRPEKSVHDERRVEGAVDDVPRGTVGDTVAHEPGARDAAFTATVLGTEHGGVVQVDASGGVDPERRRAAAHLDRRGPEAEAGARGSSTGPEGADLVPRPGRERGDRRRRPPRREGR